MPDSCQPKMLPSESQTLILKPNNLQVPQEPTNLKQSFRERATSGRSVSSYVSVVLEPDFNDLTTELDSEPRCCCFRSSLGLLLYQSFCIVYLLSSIASYINSDLLVYIAIIVAISVPAVFIGILGLKCKSSRMILTGMFAQVVITCWNLVSLAFAALVLAGRWSPPTIFEDLVQTYLVELLNMPEHFASPIIMAVLVLSVVVLVIVMLKNVWILKKMNEYRHWCKKTLPQSISSECDEA